ncbi:MAG: TRAP transporter small permease [Spartobacteria bacterium]|nr:TRAP transporter small permease [Spartobacteria bacterium]
MQGSRKIHSLVDGYTAVLRLLVQALALLSGVGIVSMMGVTCVDVVMRAFNRPLTGAYDMVKIAGVITIACALPYTTAVKGHVAVEYFFHKLSHRGRIVVDSLSRAIIIILFVILSVRCYVYGLILRESGEVTATMQLPVFWVPMVLAVSCGIVVLVVLHNLLHPGKVMIKP